MGEIKSNFSEAKRIGALIQSKSSSIDKQNIQYATESTLAAVSNSKSAYETEENAVSNYKAVLSADAGNIASLGAELAAVDKKISASIYMHM